MNAAAANAASAACGSQPAPAVPTCPQPASPLGELGQRGWHLPPQGMYQPKFRAAPRWPHRAAQALHPRIRSWTLDARCGQSPIVAADAMGSLLRLWSHCQDCGAAAEALGLLLRLWSHCQGCRTAAHLAALCSPHLAPSRFPSRVRPGPDVCGTLAWLALH